MRDVNEVTTVVACLLLAAIIACVACYLQGLADGRNDAIRLIETARDVKGKE